MFSASVIVLSSTNKKAFMVCMYMLRGITVEHFTQPNTHREEIFRQLGKQLFPGGWIFTLVTSIAM